MCGARCRVPREARGGRRSRQAACRGGLKCILGAGHGEERTANMPYMLVLTLDVSKLSGWLNFESENMTEISSSVQEAGLRLAIGRGDMRFAMRTVKHVGHVCDLGRVEAAHWPVEFFRDLPSQKEDKRHTIQGDRCGPREQGRRGPREQGRRGGGAEGGAQAACKAGPTRGRGQARGRTHIEHALHICDAGRVEVHWLVERKRSLRFSGGGGGLLLGHSGRERRARVVSTPSTQLLLPECVRTSNMYFMFVTPEVCQLEMSALKRVKGWRPV